MLESEVLNKILEDFTAGNPDTAMEPVKTFCQYAATWLSSRGVVGVGHTADGMALRFADGQELLLFVPPKETKPLLPTGEIPITGTATRISKPVAGDSPSVAITGRT
jgi:hypothetical protein